MNAFFKGAATAGDHRATLNVDKASLSQKLLVVRHGLALVFGDNIGGQGIYADCWL